MKKAASRMIAVFFVLTSLGLSHQTLAQTANQYTFINSATASLVLDRNNNTVDMTTGTTSLVASGSDDVSSGVTNIGFSFTFMSSAFTQFSASSNGGIRLGGTAILNTLYGGSFPIATTPIIAPFLQI